MSVRKIKKNEVITKRCLKIGTVYIFERIIKIMKTIKEAEEEVDEWWEKQGKERDVSC